MIEDDFFATLKLKTGEELFAKVSATDEGDRTLLLVSHPIIVETIKLRGSLGGYKFEPWIKMSDEDVFIIHMTSIITMTEIKDKNVIKTYKQVVKKGFERQDPDITREMGSVGTVKQCRDMIEKLYRGEDATKDTES